MLPHIPSACLPETIRGLLLYSMAWFTNGIIYLNFYSGVQPQLVLELHVSWRGGRANGSAAGSHRGFLRVVRWLQDPFHLGRYRTLRLWLGVAHPHGRPDVGREKTWLIITLHSWYAISKNRPIFVEDLCFTKWNWWEVGNKEVGFHSFNKKLTQQPNATNKTLDF